MTFFYRFPFNILSETLRNGQVMAKALLATLPTPPTAATARRPGTTSSTSTWAALQPAVTAAWQNGVYRRDFQAVTSVTLKAADDLVLTR